MPLAAPGLIFFCNPNNPVATYVGARATRDFLARVNRISPETVMLVDEAYFDYVTHADHATHIPQAIEDPRIVVARTFSKAYGLAGLRIGYAVGHADAIRKMNEWESAGGTSSLNVLAMHAATAAVNQDASFIRNERDRNTAVRDFTMKWFNDRGMKPTGVAHELHVREHRPAGAAVPRSVRRQGRPRRAQLPAVRELALPHLLQHDGRHAEGGQGVRRSARARRRRRARRRPRYDRYDGYERVRRGTNKVRAGGQRCSPALFCFSGQLVADGV